MVKTSTALAVLWAMNAPLPALAADAHVHGHATLQVSVDGNRLLLEFTSPLDNLVGFEHAPRNEKQTAAVRGMAARLHEPSGLFVPTPEAACAPASVELKSAVLEPALLARKAAPRPAPERPVSQPARGKGTQAEHAALSADSVFNCERPEKLTSLEVRIFDVFAQVRRLDVQVAGPRKQVSARLTARSRRVSW